MSVGLVSPGLVPLGLSPDEAAATGTHTTTGALVADAATLSGAALHPHTTTGALSAQSATMAGTAVHPHTTTGALSADAATMSGSAARTSGAVTHTTTGALAADAATIAGSAAHLTLHTTTGALVADSAAISGTAQNGSVLPKMAAAGSPAKRIRRRYQVEIDGETFDVESPEEAKQVLETLRQAAEEKAAEAIQKATQSKRLRPHKVVRDARKDLAEPQIVAPPQFAGLADSVLEQVRSVYADALKTIEIAALMRQREIDDDDEEILLLL